MKIGLNTSVRFILEFSNGSIRARVNTYNVRMMCARSCTRIRADVARTCAFMWASMCAVCNASRYVGARIVHRGDDMCIDVHRWCAMNDVKCTGCRSEI